MTIEKKLELVKVALENGADVSIFFSDAGKESDAKAIAEKLQPHYESAPTFDKNGNHQWIGLDPPEDEEVNRVETAIFYDVD
jgi:hypothetical protein